MARSSLVPRPSTITVLLRGTRRQSRTFTLALVNRRAVGDPLVQLGVLHSTETVVMIVVPLLMMIQMILELSLGRGRALIEGQVMIAQMMMR